jgi:tRNA (guanine10-N2)-dimethyltransferase
MQSLVILGRQPYLGIAELESLYGAEKVRPLGLQAAVLDIDPCLLAFDRLGGGVKFAKILTELETSEWHEIDRFLRTTGPKQSQLIPKGKLNLGISAYGFNASAKQVQAMAIALKLAIKNTGRSVRVVPNKETYLNSAQVIHNHLTDENGWELLLIKNGKSTVIGQTIKTQDIAAYGRRDQGRPARDPKVGMLPPKLAQIIINLSVGLLPKAAERSICATPRGIPLQKIHFKDRLLDPFCGTGVIIQEAGIMGYDSIGTDINVRMVNYAKANIKWLAKLPQTPLNPDVSITIYPADATKHHWTLGPDFIASETFLGKPLPASVKINDLKPVIAECNDIIQGFLANIYQQIDKGSRLCLAVPAWRNSNGRFTHLPLIDSLEVIGYNRVSFVHAPDEQLIYYRPDQRVARELLVLTKI